MFYLVYDLTFEIHYVNPMFVEADKIDDIIQNEVDFVNTRLNAGNDHAPNYDTENCFTVQNENRSPYLEKLIDWENLSIMRTLHSG